MKSFIKFLSEDETPKEDANKEKKDQISTNDDSSSTQLRGTKVATGGSTATTRSNVDSMALTGRGTTIATGGSKATS